jgi:hypothetical protein
MMADRRVPRAVLDHQHSKSRAVAPLRSKRLDYKHLHAMKGMTHRVSLASTLHYETAPFHFEMRSVLASILAERVSSRATSLSP